MLLTVTRVVFCSVTHTSDEPEMGQVVVKTTHASVVFVRVEQPVVVPRGAQLVMVDVMVSKLLEVETVNPLGSA